MFADFKSRAYPGFVLKRTCAAKNSVSFSFEFEMLSRITRETLSRSEMELSKIHDVTGNLPRMEMPNWEAPVDSYACRKAR